MPGSRVDADAGAVTGFEIPAACSAVAAEGKLPAPDFQWVQGRAIATTTCADCRRERLKVVGHHRPWAGDEGATRALLRHQQGDIDGVGRRRGDPSARAAAARRLGRGTCPAWSAP